MRRRGNRVSLGVALRPALVLSIVGVVLVSVGAPSIGLAQTVEKSDLPKSGEPTIGVQLAVSPEKVLFGSASGRFRLEAPYNQKGKIDFGRTVSKILEIDRMSIDYRKTQKGSGKYAVAPEAGRQAVQFSDGHPFRLRAEGAPVTEVAGRTYEGWIEMIWIPEAEGAGSWRMVNRVPMERYLMGVLAGEMTAAEPAALQAQAITARSFALYQMLTRAPGSSIHVDSTIRSQKYVGGRPSDAIVDAVERTRGQVLFHQGRLFKVQYHSTCGGSTASGRAVFGLPSIKSLTSVKCPYCKNEPVTRKGWNCTIAEAKIREVVRRVAGAPPPDTPARTARTRTQAKERTAAALEGTA